MTDSGPTSAKTESTDDVDLVAIDPEDLVPISQRGNQVGSELTVTADNEDTHGYRVFVMVARSLSGRHQASFARYQATVSARPSSKVCCGA